jgi:D-alanyl-D-alanine dipeptidase
MNLEEKLLRSRSNESVDFSKFQSINKKDPLIKMVSSDKILVFPNWTVLGDFEGNMYADYISKHPEYDGIYVRSELLKRVERAAQSLTKPHKLVIRAGHRPIAVQKRLLKECAADYKKDNPDVSDEEALEHARDFVSDPDITLPPHVCGAAVDVEIIDSTTGKYLDFGSTMNDDNEKSFLYCPDLTETQKANRLMLVKVMLNAGLASCKTEWWHFSYGDQLWAWFYHKENSLYDPIDL